VTDPVSFLWRWELAGHPRDANAWRIMHDLANSAFPRAGVAFSDMHIALAQAVAGNDAALEARAREMDELARKGRYPSGPLVPVVARAFAPLPQMLASVAPLCGAETRVLAMKGIWPAAELAALPAAWRVTGSRELTIPGLDAARCLIVLAVAGRSSP